MIGILKSIKILKQIKNGTFNMRGFASEEVNDMTRGVLAVPIYICAGLSILFLFLGFSSFWFGPVTFFGILGFLMIIPLFTLIKIKEKITDAIKEHIEETK